MQKKSTLQSDGKDMSKECWDKGTFRYLFFERIKKIEWKLKGKLR